MSNIAMGIKLLIAIALTVVLFWTGISFAVEPSQMSFVVFCCCFLVTDRYIEDLE